MKSALLLDFASLTPLFLTMLMSITLSNLVVLIGFFSVTATDYPTLSAPFAGAYTNYPVNVNGQDINLNTDFVDGPYVALGNIHPIHDGDVNNDGNYELQGIQVGGNSGVFNVANNNFVIEETNNSALIGVGYTAWFNLATYNGELYQRTALNGSHFTIHLENIDLVGGDADGKSYEIVMTLNTMPEPSSIALFGIAIAGMFLRKRRKK